MKRDYTRTLILLIAAVIFSISCSKDRGIKATVEIEDKNLTACPANFNCEYLFTEHAQVNAENGAITTGVNRVFWASILASDGSNVQTTGRGYTLYIDASMQGNTFSLKKEDILAGKVKLMRQGCPTCYMAPARPLIDGYVKGINRSPEKPADQTKWLLEIQVILAPEVGQSTNETVNMKQYFYPNFIYN